MGFGLLPSSRRTAELVNEKWAPRSPDLPDQAPVPQDVLDKVFGVSLVSKAVSHLAAGAAGDSLGWTREMAQVLHSQAGSFPLVSEILKAMHSIPTHTLAWRLMMVSKIVPLAKDEWTTKLV